MDVGELRVQTRAEQRREERGRNRPERRGARLSNVTLGLVPSRRALVSGAVARGDNLSDGSLAEHQADAVASVVSASDPLHVVGANAPRHQPEGTEVLQQLTLVVGHLLEGLDGEEPVSREIETSLAWDGVELVVRHQRAQHVTLGSDAKTFLALVRRLSRLGGHEKRRARSEEGRERERLVRHAQRASVHDELPESGVGGELREEFPQRGEMFVVHGEGADAPQILHRVMHRGGLGGLGQPRAHLLGAPGEAQRLDTHHQLLQTDAAHLGVGVSVEFRIRREEVERDARAYATGAAPSLLRRRVGDGDVVQAAHETLGVVSLLLDPPGVHHAHDIVDGDGRLGDVGGEHNLDDARGRAHKHPSLFLGRERAVQGQDPVRIQAKPPAAGVRAVRGGDEELANVINLSDAGKKDEDGGSAGAGAPVVPVAFLLLRRPAIPRILPGAGEPREGGVHVPVSVVDEPRDELDDELIVHHVEVELRQRSRRGARARSVTVAPRQARCPLHLGRRSSRLVVRRLFPRFALVLVRSVAPLRVPVDPVSGRRDGVLQVQRRHGKRATREGHAGRAVEVPREHVPVHRGGHQAELHVRSRALGRALAALASAQEFLERHEQEIALHRSLVHLVHQDVRHSRERGIALQPTQQDARRAEEQSRVVARLGLAPDGVSHGADADPRLAAFRRDALRHADGRDAPRLRADDVHGGVGLVRVFQQVLRHLRGLPAARLALDDGDGVIVEGVHERGAMAKHREGPANGAVRAPAGGRGRGEERRAGVVAAVVAGHLARLLIEVGEVGNGAHAVDGRLLEEARRGGRLRGATHGADGRGRHRDATEGGMPGGTVLGGAGDLLRGPRGGLWGFGLLAERAAGARGGPDVAVLALAGVGSGVPAAAAVARAGLGAPVSVAATAGTADAAVSASVTARRECAVAGDGAAAAGGARGRRGGGSAGQEGIGRHLVQLRVERRGMPRRGGARGRGRVAGASRGHRSTVRKGAHRVRRAGGGL